MTLHAASCELSSITHSGTGAEDTTAGRFQSNYGIRMAAYPNSTSAAEWIGTEQGLGAFGTFWHRGFFALPNSTFDNGRTLYEYINSGAVPVFRFQSVGVNSIQPQYWNGAAWTNIGGTFAVGQATLARFDIKIICGAGGSFEVYYGTNMANEGVLVSSGSANMAAVTNIDRIKGYSTSATGGNQGRHSEWIWGDEPTIAHRYALAPPTGNGTDTAGSGSYLDVDDTTTADADSTTLAAAGDAETYVHAAMALPAGTVKAVQLEARVRVSAGGAQNVKGRLRVGGVAYDQAANYGALGPAYGAYRPRWPTNPAGGAWTTATAGQVGNEFGLLAQA